LNIHQSLRIGIMAESITRNEYKVIGPNGTANSLPSRCNPVVIQQRKPLRDIYDLIMPLICSRV